MSRSLTRQPQLFTRSFSSSTYIRNRLRPEEAKLVKDGEEATDAKPPQPQERRGTVTHSSFTEKESRRQRDDASQSARERLHRWTSLNAAALRARADSISAAAVTKFSQLGGKLNQVTGYEEIEALKRQVVDNGTFVYLTRNTRQVLMI